MSEASRLSSRAPSLAWRTDAIFGEHLEEDRRLVDRMFATLLLLEWLASIVVALVVSPTAWAGETSRVHIHVWAAVVLGGLTISLPVALILTRPARSSTRQSVAIGQMLVVALLIHLTEGRPESHFHVFGSLAFLALYRDWRVMLTASVVVALDHYLRGIYWPRSLFGILAADRWRWAEHSLWVAFEVTILTFGTNRSLGVMREAARRQSEVEATRDRVEATFSERTAELRRAQAELEDRVHDRTIRLQQANESLRSEIAERRKAEDDLRASEERFRTLAETLPQIVWVTDADGGSEYFNTRWYDYTGLTPERSLGRGWLDVIPPDDRGRTVEAWTQAISTGSPYQIEYRLRRAADDSSRWHLGRALPIRNEGGAIVRWFGTCTDIHDQREAAEDLRRARDELEGRVRERTAALERANSDLLVEVDERRKAELEALRSRETAEEANRAKGQFLANMSHEIRTPMNAIIGMTEVTLGTDLLPNTRENLEVVRVAADALLNLIDDILDFSKIEAGRLDLDPIRFHPRETIDAAVKTVSIKAREKGLELSTLVAPEVPGALIGDPLRLRQVLLNLLGNAITFTAQGRVEVRVVVETVGREGVVLRFSVSDEGIGIPSSRLSMIFDPFSQADSSTTRRFGGTGLGLSISSRLVDLMGGRIWVESEIGRGSAFHFTAHFATSGATADPAELAQPAKRRPDEAQAGRRLRVLLVDDNALNRRVGLLLLQRLGHEVQLAIDGPDALARFEEEGPFDLVLMDIQMPEMDGFEATTRIREVRERLERKCPIVALAAFAMKGDRERCLVAGMDEHLAKPIRADDLERLLGRLLPDDAAPGEPSTPGWCPSPEEIRASFPMDDAEMSQIVGIFRETCVEEVSRMARAIAEHDPGTLSKAAHGLMSCLGMFGSGEIVALAATLEEVGRSRRLADAADSLAKLQEAIRGMQPTLDRLAGARQPGGLHVGRSGSHGPLRSDRGCRTCAFLPGGPCSCLTSRPRAAAPASGSSGMRTGRGPRRAGAGRAALRASARGARGRCARSPFARGRPIRSATGA